MNRWSRALAGALCAAALAGTAGCGPVGTTNKNFDSEKSRMEQKYGKPGTSPGGPASTGMTAPPGATGQMPGGMPGAPGGMPGAPGGAGNMPGGMTPPPGAPR